MPHTPPQPATAPPPLRRSRVSARHYSSNRYSPKSHNAVKKTTSNVAGKPTPFERTNGSTSSSPAVTSVLTPKIGVKIGSRNSGNTTSRMRACAEIAESAVPAMETPRLPRKNTSSNCPRILATGRLYKIENTGSINSSVTSKNSVLAASLANKIAKGSLTDNRSALNVSLVCSRKKHGCSINDAANKNASHKSPAPNRRDSAEDGSNVKLNSTTTIKIKTTVVISNSRERNSVRSSLPSSTPVLDSKLIQPPENASTDRTSAPSRVSATISPASSRTARVASAAISDSPCRLISR